MQDSDMRGLRVCIENRDDDDQDDLQIGEIQAKLVKAKNGTGIVAKPNK